MKIIYSVRINRVPSTPFLFFEYKFNNTFIGSVLLYLVCCQNAVIYKI